MLRSIGAILLSALNASGSESRKNQAGSLTGILKLSFFVLVSVCVLQGWSTPTSAAVCGNGILEAGEQCDLGNGPDGNGSLGACCDGSCNYQSAAYVCRPSADVCDVAETCLGGNAFCPPDKVEPAGPFAGCDDSNPCSLDQCNGTSKACQHPADKTSEGTECRAAADICDVAEVCNGSSPDCPDDEFEPEGTVCGIAENACESDPVCSGDSADCQPAEPATPTVACTVRTKDVKGTNESDVIECGDTPHTVKGRGGDDCIETGTGNDTIAAGPGNDFVEDAGGDNKINLGEGDDTLIFDSTGAKKNDIQGGKGADFIADLCRGSSCAKDKIRGGEANDNISSGDGNDLLTGDDGDDALYGNGGNDCLNGGTSVEIVGDYCDGGPDTDCCLNCEFEVNCESDDPNSSICKALHCK